MYGLEYCCFVRWSIFGV